MAGAREAELAAAILGYRQVVLEAVEETENALGAWAAQERRAQRIDAQLQASRRADAHAGLLYGRGMINLLERLTASVGHRQAELAAVEASEGRALAFVAVNKATGAVACSVLARERMGCAHFGQARLGAYHRPAPERRMTRHLGGMDARRARAPGEACTA